MALVVGAALLGLPARAGPSEPVELRLVVDADDDDANGVPDGEQELLRHAVDVAELPLPTGAARTVPACASSTVGAAT